MASLLNATIADLSEALSDGRLSSAALTTAYIAQILEANDYFYAVIETNPDAMDIAHALDEEQHTKGRRGPLHGIPILLTDSISTLDDMEATAGSAALLGTRNCREATLVRRLRDAGAVILGQTNMTDAYCFNMSGGGSSCGSAVATALGLAATCIGCETDGGIIYPASHNGVVAIKPTVGLVSADGVIPVALKQDAAGPMARTVSDVACLLEVLAEESTGRGHVSYTSALTGTDLSGLRIGVPSSCLVELSGTPLKEFNSALSLLEFCEATIVRDTNYACLNDFLKLSEEEMGCVVAGCFQNDIRKYLADLATNSHEIKSLGGIIEVAVLLDDYFGGDGGISGTLKEHKLDLIVAPAVRGSEIDSTSRSGLSVIVSLAARGGLPVVTVPLGKYPETTAVRQDLREPDKLVDVAPEIPFGIMFTGAAHSEETLLRVAYAFEQMTNVRDTLVPSIPPKRDIPDLDAAYCRTPEIEIQELSYYGEWEHFGEWEHVRE
ncbi:amidase signature domain-containing protein [Lasiosphaeria miniovina]|uniref:Amidase signature domain-containing protein n=1 Tax=Lasiosphaeria miniovina TaxID=1954250 RepID=A0AA40ATP6_9PEZI|nr:amidase signature domain-containing protein [Lasiosphaeria miniovina]KAK0721832.1 amidase signature domain-containing protein [Lasiosphaeria miniovina]